MDVRNWKFSRFEVLLLLLLYSNFIFCWSLNDEGLALLMFRDRIVSDPYDALNNWKDEDGVVNPCSWFGVECSDGKVVVLNLKDLCLGGTLAPDLRNLIHIKSIYLRNNSFFGIIPEGFGNLKELEVLDFGNNNFSGSLPPDLGNNISLTILLLDNNRLLGKLSPEIHQIKTFSEFQVDENQLSSAAKRSSCNRRSAMWNAVQTENAINKRQLQVANLPRVNGSQYLRSRSITPSESGNDPPQIVPSPSSPSPPENNLFPSPPLEPNSPSSAPPANDPHPSPQKPNPPPTSPNGSASNPVTIPPTFPSSNSPSKRSSSKKHVAIIAAAIGGALLVMSIIVIYICKINKATVKPWATGLSGQLQKAFITGVPKLKRSELEAGCEDFSNVIGSSPLGTLYKGTLSSGVEIAVASVAAKYSKDWPKHLDVQFWKKIETLSKVNHKNFVNLIGYCEEEEPFTRMLVFEYAPNGTLFEHLHIKESEHLDWAMRLRIGMGMAYCLEHMHQLNPPVTHNNLSSSAISLTEDYAAKISDFSFSNVITPTEMESSGKKFLDTPTAHANSNVYSFGVLLFEMITGRLPYSVDNGSLEDWASDYLRGDRPLKDMVDPTLDSFEEEKVERIGGVIKSCAHPDPERRPTMSEVTARLRDITGITPDVAIPKLSPLWWAELEISSPDAD